MLFSYATSIPNITQKCLETQNPLRLKTPSKRRLNKYKPQGLILEILLYNRLKFNADMIEFIAVNAVVNVVPFETFAADRA